MTRESAVSFFLKRCAIGILLGIAMIIPGFSGGVLAVSLGLYEPLLDAVGHFFRAPKQNFRFLLPLGLGGVVGIFLVNLVLKEVFSHYEEQLICLFIGMVAGNTPSLIREANEKGFRWGYLVAAALGAAFVVLMDWLDMVKPIVDRGEPLTVWKGLLCGGIMSVGMIVPGISTSFIFMYLGVYLSVTTAFSQLDLAQLWPLGVGFVVVSVVIIRGVGWLFKRFHGPAYYAVTGLMVGLVALLIRPMLRIEWISLVNLAVLAVGVLIGWLLDKKLGSREAVTE